MTDETPITRTEFERLPLTFGTGTLLHWTGWSRHYLNAEIAAGRIRPHHMSGRCFRWTKLQLADWTGLKL